MAGYTIRALEEIPDVLGNYPGEMRMSAVSRPWAASRWASPGAACRRSPAARKSYGHRHKTQEEVYFVASRVVKFKLEDEVIDVAAGTRGARGARGGRARCGTQGPGDASGGDRLQEVRGPRARTPRKTSRTSGRRTRSRRRAPEGVRLLAVLAEAVAVRQRLRGRLADGPA